MTSANKYVVFFHPDAMCLPTLALTPSFSVHLCGPQGDRLWDWSPSLPQCPVNSTTPDDASPLFPQSGAKGEPQGIEYPCAGLTDPHYGLL